MYAVKKFLAVLLALALCAGILAIPAFAAEVTQDGLEVTLTTDKDVYNQGETIAATLTVTNISDADVFGVTLENLVPEGYAPAEGQETSLYAEVLAAGESVTLTVLFEDQEIPEEPTEDATEAPTEAETEAPTEDVTEAPTEAETEAPTEEATEAPTDAGTSKPPKGDSTDTGDHSMLGLWVMLAAAAVIGLAVLAVKSNLWKRMLALALCLAMTASMFAELPLLVRAAEEEGVIEPELTVQVGRETVRLQAMVTYEIAAEEEDGPYTHCTVSFETYGGTEVPDQIVEVGGLAVQPEDPQREGYRLLAWYADLDMTTVYDFSTPVTENLTLHAAWEEILMDEDSYLDQDPPDVEIYDFDMDHTSIVVGEETLVTFVAEIFSETALAADEVLLYQDEETLGVMHDDGLNGDTAAGDGIYTCQAMLSGDEECIRIYQVKVRGFESDARRIVFYVPLVEDELNDMQTVDQRLAELTGSEAFDALTTAEKAGQVVALLNTLAEEGLVAADSIFYFEAGRMVCFEYACGVQGAVRLEENAEWNTGSGKGKSPDGVNESDIGDAAVNAVAQTPSLTAVGASNEREILILNAFENTSYRRDYYDNLRNSWSAMGLYTTVDVDVTVENMRRFNTTDAVVFAMHGAEWPVGSAVQPVLCINEVATAATDARYSPELRGTGTVIKVNGSYMITAQFFTDNYSSKALDGMMIFSESCMFFGCDCQSTAVNYRLSNALVGRGAEVVVGYHNSVGADYSRDVMQIVVENTFNGDTVSAALTAARSSQGNSDNWTDASDHKFAAYPVLAGIGSFVLRPDGTVKGSVKNAVDGTAIKNAMIRAYDEDKQQVAIARTDAGGAYSLRLSAGTYTLEISAGSYKKGKASVTVNSEGVTYVESFLLVSNAQNEGIAIGVITNSITGEPVPGVRVNVRKYWFNQGGEVIYHTTTNERGYYEITGLSAGMYTIEYYKTGFITGYKCILVNANGINCDAVISPVASDGVYRMVLTWGANPSDLDSHVQGTLSDGSGCHMYYSNKSCYDGGLEVCNLDVDDVSGYGPETTTVNASTHYPYYFYIYKYSGSGSIATSGAQVKVYKGNKLVRTFFAPEDQGTGRYWNVFAIVNGEIVVRDTITSSPETSYTQASYGPLKLTQDDSIVGSESSLFTYWEFKSKMEKDAVIPGLAEHMIPQGIAVSDSTGLTYVSAYYKKKGSDAKKASVIMVLDQDGKHVAEYYLRERDNAAMSGHVGGVAVTDTTLFVAWSADGSNQRIAAIPLATLTTSGSQTVKLTTSYTVPITPSFISYHDGYLWVGNFYHPTESKYGPCPEMDFPTDGCYTYIMGYNLDEGGNSALYSGYDGYATPDVVLTAPEKIQGMVYDDDSNTVVLSQSYGRKRTDVSNLRFYNLDLSAANDDLVTVGSFAVKCYFLNSSRETDVVKSLPMCEGLAVDREGHLLVVYESGAGFYRTGGGHDPTDRIWRSKNPL